MFLFRIFFLTAVFSGLALSLYAQRPTRRAQAPAATGTETQGSRVIDDTDTTKSIYGPTTSQTFSEEEVFYNRPVYYPIDTVIRNFHRFSYLQANENFYQDLGNIGTASRPIFFTLPGIIGARSGFHAYDLYWDSEQVRYFHTRSPYTNMKVILGGQGRSITRAVYSRNITPHLNFGFTYRGLFIDKQFQRRAKGDRNVRSHYYDLFGSYKTKDSTYRLFVNFRRNYHQADENGGVREFGTDFVYQDYFDIDALPQLTEASTTDFRTNIHIFHQYSAGKGLQVYHMMDRYRQRNTFSDLLEGAPENYYPERVLASDTASDKVKFKTFRNEVGIKGTLLKLFYNGYYAIRRYAMDYDTLVNVNAKDVESYLGGRVSLKLDSLLQVDGWGEVMQNGNYRIEGTLRSKWIFASVQQVQYAPSFLEQAYIGSHDVWENNFDNVNVTRLSGNVFYRAKRLEIAPGVTFTRLGNYIFFKEEADTRKVLPQQVASEQIIASPELRLSLTILKHINFRTHTIYTRLLETSDDAIQLPKVFVNAQLSYANIFFNGNLDMHAGLDFHWKSEYNALAYTITTQQFYVQQGLDDRNVPIQAVRSFPLIDLFFNAKIKRGRIFLKYNNLIQLITKEGYMVTPYYPGQRNVVDFGFDWSFYD